MAGKSAFSTRFCLGKFDPTYEKTIEFCLQPRVVTVDGINILVEIWEIGDVRRHRMGIFHRLRHFDAVVCAVNPTNAVTAHHAKDWIDFVCKFRDRQNLVRMVVGTNMDRVADRVVSRTECEAGAAACGAVYRECSSATGVGVDSVIYAVVRKVGHIGPERIRKLFSKDKPDPEPKPAQDRRDSCSIQ